jgi:dienelactone hydrolase
MNTQNEPRRQGIRPGINLGSIVVLPFRIVRLLLSDPFESRRGSKRKHGSFSRRIWRGVFYRLAIVPILVMLAVSALVYAGTHPRPPMPHSDPASDGLYFQTEKFSAQDGSDLAAWLVPAIPGNDGSSHDRPAVILVHGHGATCKQVLPLIKPLHDEGWIVLALAVRGSGTGSDGAQTFGLREADDVQTALDILRLNPAVDTNRIAVVGIDTGANACLLASDRDPKLAAAVLVNPVGSADEAIDRFVSPSFDELKWINPLCKWAFNAVYAVDLDEIDISRHGGALANRPVLTVSSADSVDPMVSTVLVDRIDEFLKDHLKAK